MCVCVCVRGGGKKREEERREEGNIPTHTQEEEEEEEANKRLLLFLGMEVEKGMKPEISSVSPDTSRKIQTKLKILRDLGLNMMKSSCFFFKVFSSHIIFLALESFPL